MHFDHRLPAETAARPRVSSAPASIPEPPPGAFEQTKIFCSDLPPPRSPRRSAPAHLTVLRDLAARTIAVCWEAYKLASTIVTSALLLVLLAIAVYGHAPVANPPQPPAGRHSPCLHPGSPPAVAEFE